MARHWTGVWLFYHADVDCLPGLWIDKIIFLVGKSVDWYRLQKKFMVWLGAKQ
jgi:hypothetical protein